MKSENTGNAHVQMLGQALARKRELSSAETVQVAGGALPPPTGRWVDTWCATEKGGCVDREFI